MENLVSVKSIQSSKIHKVSYDKVTKTMYITFKNGCVYRYLDVPEDVFNGFGATVLAAKSVKQYFYENVKGRFQNEMV